MTADELVGCIDGFFEAVASRHLEIYNEFSVQHELGVYLRSRLGPAVKVQFERPVEYFGLSRTGLTKRETDLTVLGPGQRDKIALELKYPRNAQYPEQMFAACEDIAFLEELVLGGFSLGCFVMVADDPHFWRGESDHAPYWYFRGGRTLTGSIQKPTGKKDRSVELHGQYRIHWKPAGPVRYAVVTVGPREVLMNPLAPAP